MRIWPSGTRWSRRPGFKPSDANRIGGRLNCRGATERSGERMEFTNRVAVITGGGSGIGRAVAAAMARRDVAAVALVDVSEAVDEVASTLNADAGRTVAI